MDELTEGKQIAEDWLDEIGFSEQYPKEETEKFANFLVGMAAAKTAMEELREE